MKYLIIILAAAIAIILKIINGLDYFLNFCAIQQYENCQYLDLDMKGPEDMQQYNRTTIFIGAGNFQKLYAQNKIELEQQGIYAIINSDQQDFQVMQLQMIGYPKEIALNIHGIYLRKQNNRDFFFQSIMHTNMVVKGWKYFKYQNNQIQHINILFQLNKIQ